MPKYPDIHVTLTGENGNAYAVIGAVRSALRRNKVSSEEIAAFANEAMSGDYDNVLTTCTNWVSVS